MAAPRATLVHEVSPSQTVEIICNRDSSTGVVLSRREWNKVSTHRRGEILQVDGPSVQLRSHLVLSDKVCGHANPIGADGAHHRCVLSSQTTAELWTTVVIVHIEHIAVVGEDIQQAMDNIKGLVAYSWLMTHDFHVPHIAGPAFTQLVEFDASLHWLVFHVDSHVGSATPGAERLIYADVLLRNVDCLEQLKHKVNTQ